MNIWGGNPGVVLNIKNLHVRNKSLQPTVVITEFPVSLTKLELVLMSYKVQCQDAVNVKVTPRVSYSGEECLDKQNKKHFASLS
jgi:hypothetical protein